MTPHRRHVTDAEYRDAVRTMKADLRDIRATLDRIELASERGFADMEVQLRHIRRLLIAREG